MNLTSIGVTKSVWDPATPHSKANKQAGLVERKGCFISDASNCRGSMVDICPKANSPPTPDKQGMRAFIEGGGSGVVVVGGWAELHAETAQSSLTVIFRLVILVVLGS